MSTAHMTPTAPNSESYSQRRKIESVHRGFLYQHLYAAACLLTADEKGIEVVVVEGDEDIEVTKENCVNYLQIKTRSETLIPSNLTESLDRFDWIRAEHASGERAGTAFFCFISNQPPGPKLTEQLESKFWPPDVEVIWPGKPRKATLEFLPPAWRDLSEAVVSCTAYAEQIPYRNISADTLVWKLAAIVMLAASGGAPYENHKFLRADLSRLFEQIIISLQAFPPPPLDYRSQVDEPELRSPKHLRMIAGFSGAGKTAWASHAAIHSDGLFIYYDVGDEPGSAMPGSLAREIAATFSALEPTKPMNEIMVPSSSGLDSLRQLSSYASSQGLDVNVAIDNAHRVSANVMRSVIESTASLNFVLLAHPGDVIEELEAIFGEQHEQLHGWSEDTIAAVVSELGARGTPSDLRRLSRMTSGMPLYIQSAARASIADFNGDIGSFCKAVEAQIHTKRTPQEIILSKIYQTLPTATQEAVAVMSFPDVPLTQAEIASILKASLQLEPAGTTSLIRELRPLGIVRSIGGHNYAVHDAFRVIGKQQFEQIGAEKQKRAHKSLIALLMATAQTSRDTNRLSMMIRSLCAIGEYRVLIGFSGEEMFHEFGIDDGIWELLEGVVESGQLEPSEQFNALDGLVFHYLKLGLYSKARDYVKMMEDLIASAQLNEEDRRAFLSKKMQCQAESKDSKGVHESLRLMMEIIPNDPHHRRVLEYNNAQALWELGEIVEAESILRKLVEDYMTALELKPSHIYGENLPSIFKRLKKNADESGMVKHLADALEFHAKTLDRMGVQPTSIRIQAMKFYQIIEAFDSLTRVGMDVVDDFLAVKDNYGAKEFSEKFLMPAANKLGLPIAQIFVRSQYAVVLARCGEVTEAEEILKKLRPYYSGVDDEAREGLMENESLVKRVMARPVTRQIPLPSKVVGRNAPCPCGSGAKYKKCHGR